MADEERALLERCGYRVEAGWPEPGPDLSYSGPPVGYAVRSPYGNYVDPAGELAFVRRGGEEAAASLASLTTISGVSHARGVRALWDLDPSLAGTFPRDDRHLELELAAARRRDVERHVPEDCR